MSDNLIVFHTIDTTTLSAVPFVLLSSLGGPGPWQALGNACGDTQVTLTPGHYDITFTKTGYAPRVLPADLADSGVVTVGLDPAVGPLPPAPTRAQVCALQTSLQGLTYTTTQYGPIPAWFYAGLSTTDRTQARAAHRAAGDTHIPIGISEAYRESGTLWPDALRDGWDYAYDLDAYRAVITPVIADGFYIDLPLAGDGLSVNAQPQPGEYNDPVGRTYGYQWLMNELPRIVAALQQPPDLTPYILFRPGWDGVFYGWAPQQVDAFGQLFRLLLPAGHLAIEHDTGHIPCGEGGADYAPGGLMQNFDTVLSEFDDVHSDSCWQIVARMVPAYGRPPDQPSGDDPHAPYYLAPGTPRGPYFYVAFEPTIGGVYQWCRGQCTVDDVNTVRRYLRSMGVTYTG